MAKYALAKGKPVPAKAIKSIESFEDRSPDEIGEDAPPRIRRDIDIAALVDVHGLLTRLIEPAIPQTVLLLYVEQKTETALKFLGPVSLVRQLMLAAVISLLVFVTLMASPFINGTKLAEDVLSANGIEQIARLIFYIGAAGLGASFTALYTANIFISKGTYDPCYQSSYWIRFLLGIIAGLLLAILVSEQSIQSDGGMLSNGIIRPLLAILGGFSADLLYTFLNRMVETFKSLFEGNTQNMLDAKAQEAKAKLAELETEGRMKLAQQLMQMQQQLGAEKTDPEQIKQQIDEILQNLTHAK
ncbi:MAG: hypothetical protein M0Q44_16615 [Methylobacter sp.]|nr:hypothetical protein [Methylobacter sp.]